MRTLNGQADVSRSFHGFGWAVVALAVLQLSAADEALAQGAPVVEVATPLTERVIDWDEYTGRFEAVQSVVLQARVSGYLDKIHFQEGDRVEAGQLLYQIDPRPFQADVAQAQARLEAAIALRELALIEVERADELFRREVGPRSEAQRRRAEYQEAVANVALAEAELTSAQLDLEFTEIRAPISGRISATNVDEGNLVIGGPNGATVLANIVTITPIEFVFTVSEADFLRYARLDATGVRPSSRDFENTVFVKLQDEETWPWEGRMTFVDNQIDPNSGTLEGRATFANSDGFLQPGLFGRLRLAGSLEYDAVLIPDEAIVSDQSHLLVYVVEEDNVVAERRVILGPLHRGFRVIREGLTTQDRVVVSGVQRARPGAPVTPNMMDLAFGASE